VSDLDDILVDGETVLWTGAPNWASASKPKTGWRAKTGTIKFAALMLFAFLTMMAFGMLVDAQGFAGGMLGVLILLSAIAFVIAFFNVIANEETKIIQQDHLYAITDMRVIIHDRTHGTTQSVLGPVLLEVATGWNGETKNLNIRFTHGEDDFATLFALIDAETPAKLLIKNFSRRKAES
jgi:hypothetical protein